MPSLENYFCKECLVGSRINDKSFYTKSNFSNNVVFNICNESHYNNVINSNNHGSIYLNVAVGNYALIGYWFAITNHKSDSLNPFGYFHEIIFFIGEFSYKKVIVEYYRIIYQNKFILFDFMPNNTEEDIAKAIAKVENLLYLG